MDNHLENNATGKSNLSFQKGERLCSKKLIEKLFEEGNSFLAYPFKIVFLKIDHHSKFPVQVGFSVGKRNFKRAVKRNLIKRRMREAFRLNKSGLYSSMGENKLAVFIIFIGKSVPEYPEVDAGIKKGFKKLIKEISGIDS